MNKTKMLVGIIVFGSLWGFSECIIAPYLGDAGLPSGAIMTGFFAIGLMTLSRLLFRQRGMQFGMGMVAGTLRLFNPFGGCVICSGIAIMAEGLLFEFIWYSFSEMKQINTNTLKISMGIISGYILYVGGYIVTQILTPLSSSAGFNPTNLVGFIPQILSRGLIAALVGGFTIPIVFILKTFDINSVRDKIYYPTAAGITIGCWSIVLVNLFISIGA